MKKIKKILMKWKWKWKKENNNDEKVNKWWWNESVMSNEMIN